MSHCWIVKKDACMKHLAISCFMESKHILANWVLNPNVSDMELMPTDVHYSKLVILALNILVATLLFILDLVKVRKLLRR